MNELQQALVADHIASLEREGAALRAERFRTKRADPDEPRDDHHPDPGAPSARVRVGHWLIAVGRTIAGTPHRAAAVIVDDAADDCPDALSPAA